jgi:DNA-binding transcriptional LysR family regulator
MNVEGLRVFLEVARLRSVSKAAEALDLAQPTVSTSLQNLERFVGVKLIDRGRRPLHLTPSGERLLRGVRAALHELDRALADVRHPENDVAGPITVASIYSVGLYHADAFRRFMEAYPRVAARIQYLRPNLVVKAVETGEAVLGLTSYPKATRDLGVVPWREQEMVLLCPPRHPLASRPRAALAELAGEAFVGFDPDLEIRRHTDAAFRKAGVTVDVVLEFDNIETVKQAVQVGSGLALLPAETVQHEAQTGLLAAVSLDPPDLRRPVGVLYRRHEPLPIAAVKFVETLTGRAFPDEHANLG